MTVYVCTTDTFMSGWGQADGLINKLIILCATSKEAETVVNNAVNRADQECISCSTTPPQYFHKKWENTGADYVAGNYYVQIKTREDMPTWFKPGAF